MSIPVNAGSPSIYIRFSLDPDDYDWGSFVTKFEMIGMMNGGYALEVRIKDARQLLFERFEQYGYFENTRKRPMYVHFFLASGAKGGDWKIPRERTRIQEAIVSHVEYHTPEDDATYLSFVAIDPPSYFLSIGDGGGEVYRGNISGVIEKVVKEYAPEIEVKVEKTIDSELNYFYMLRQDAKTFITSLLEWTVPFNQSKTLWLNQIDGKKLYIESQGKITPRNRAVYNRKNGENVDLISKADMETNNSFRQIAVKLFSYGTDVRSGQYLDKTNDKNELFTVAKDSTTQTKQFPKIEELHSFKKPDDSPNTRAPQSGSTYISPMPEYFSSGDIGLEYKEYINGRAKNTYLNVNNSIITCKIETRGHGEFIDTFGLGVDTIFIDWKKPRLGSVEYENYWMYGYWTVYGFEHSLSAGRWYTRLYIARPDQDCKAVIIKPDLEIEQTENNIT